jgi:hypothetical protein
MTAANNYHLAVVSLHCFQQTLTSEFNSYAAFTPHLTKHSLVRSVRLSNRVFAGRIGYSPVELYCPPVE